MRIGIDLGGTKIEGVALADDGRVLVRRRVATPQGDYTGTLTAVVRLVEILEKEVGGVGHVGIGIPGAISSASGRVKNANSTWLIGERLPIDLESRLRRPVRIANDANCFALSEAIDGGGAGGHIVFGVIIGTGTGGGLVVNREVLVGANAIAGEWGHNPLPWPRDGEWPGPPCYCGRTGCIEMFLSGPGLSRDFRDATGRWLSAEAIASGAAEGDPDALAARARYEDRMARALASVINVVDPDIIVLGGGLSNIEHLYVGVPTLWGQFVFSDTVATRLVPALHGDASGVRGAAWLWGE